METKKTKIRKKFKGVVVSDKMAKTIVVKVMSMKLHPKYKKQYKVSKKYKVHDEQRAAKVGSEVIFQECRPLSKEKKWRLIKIVK
ncbi:MAG: 30S ribosomal protein S17 [Patescibacteria group bacterium]